MSVNDRDIGSMTNAEPSGRTLGSGEAIVIRAHGTVESSPTKAHEERSLHAVLTLLRRLLFSQRPVVCKVRQAASCGERDEVGSFTGRLCEAISASRSATGAAND